MSEKKMNHSEIKYCIASLLRFAPFLRTIWLITDNQDPMIWDVLEQHFPGQSSKVKIVDHTVLYRGYSQYLPVFNSLSIETVMWRIPGLSEHFIYLNDDFMLVAPTTPSDYFVGEKAVCYAMWFSLPFANLLQFLKPKKNGHKVFTFKHSMVNAATAIGEKWRFFRLGHNPQSMKVSTFSKFFEEHPDLMISNMSCRFREQHQYNPAELFFLLSAKEDKLILHTKKGVNLYLLPKGHKYMESHIHDFRSHFYQRKSAAAETGNLYCHADRIRAAASAYRIYHFLAAAFQWHSAVFRYEKMVVLCDCQCKCNRCVLCISGNERDSAIRRRKRIC